ncbi:hypothetical protein PPTG_24956 [Phytophthora nicotianae INRA-310]|uniref:Uncharacterized protein n=1 Tax=Phytophthora nicotianae (strain INRA-310) TaxID=761204 RepID=W2P9U3_PHYN3|nr:hypothetical protein PPTG_24956 [Phytophthora nicotianae INRA-310]ETM97430.1 hypothetical protein PPTG_24956 [Phytophthora nicotianae INRA-310]
MNQPVPASADIEGPAQELVVCTPQQVFTDIRLQGSNYPDGSVISRAVQEHLQRSEDDGLALKHRCMLSTNPLASNYKEYFKGPMIIKPPCKTLMELGQMLFYATV